MDACYLCIMRSLLVCLKNKKYGKKVLRLRNLSCKYWVRICVMKPGILSFSWFSSATLDACRVVMWNMLRTFPATHDKIRWTLRDLSSWYSVVKLGINTSSYKWSTQMFQRQEDLQYVLNVLPQSKIQVSVRYCKVINLWFANRKQFVSSRIWGQYFYHYLPHSVYRHAKYRLWLIQCR